MKINKLTLSLLGAFSTMAWFVMFGVGLFVNSKPYRDSVASNFEMRAFFISLLTYTPTNIAVLTICSSLCGGCASSLITHSRHTTGNGGKSGDLEGEMTTRGIENPIGSVIRGFVVYMAFLGGVYISTNAPFDAATAEQYARAAGAISLLAFVVGFDQTVFKNILQSGPGIKK
jgi:hypothetical protein